MGYHARTGSTQLAKRKIEYYITNDAISILEDVL